MKRINLSSAAQPLGEYASDLRDEIVLLTNRNRAVAATVPVKNFARESLTLSHHQKFHELKAQSRAVLLKWSPNTRSTHKGHCLT